MVGDICPAIDTTSTKLLIRGGIEVLLLIHLEDMKANGAL